MHRLPQSGRVCGVYLGHEHDPEPELVAARHRRDGRAHPRPQLGDDAARSHQDSAAEPEDLIRHDAGQGSLIPNWLGSGSGPVRRRAVDQSQVNSGRRPRRSKARQLGTIQFLPVASCRPAAYPDVHVYLIQGSSREPDREHGARRRAGSRADTALMGWLGRPRRHRRDDASDCLASSSPAPCRCAARRGRPPRTASLGSPPPRPYRAGTAALVGPRSGDSIHRKRGA